MERHESFTSINSSDEDKYNKSTEFDKSGVSFALPTRRIFQIVEPETDTNEDDRVHAKMSIDVPPDIDFYRKNTEAGGKFVRTRPSIYDLMEGGLDRRDFQSNAMKESPKQEIRRGVKFGWIEGVYIRCLQNIIGVILFIRISWVAAQCGILVGSLLICVASAVTLITTLSLSAICTNGEVKGGGLYYLISRTLGPEFGGSIGIMFAFGNACSAALYVIGMGETIVEVLKNYGIMIIDGGINDIRLIGLALAFLLKGVILIGISFESLLQKVMLFPMSISILGFIIGSFLPPSMDKAVKGFTSWHLDTITSNLLPRFVNGDNFFTVFAVYFPAATGIMAGANISGDLKNPQEAIPKGTVLAILTSTIVYIITLFVSGAVFVRHADGLTPGLPYPTIDCAQNSTCTYGLYNYYQVMATVSIWSPLVIIGIIAATSSSALAAMVSAPKILQAVCNDKLFPLIDKLGSGYGKDNAPRLAYLVTFGITLLGVAIGELNSIAPIISNFFLAAYTLVNYACFDASFAGNAGFRPAFKYYSMYLSLFGALICILIMFTMNWVTALITFLVFFLIFGFLKYRKPDVNWGSSMHANQYKRTLKGIHRLNKEGDHVKNYRPQILVLSYPGNRDLAVFASSITRGASLVVHANIIKEEPSARIYTRLSEMNEKEREWMRNEGIKAFPINYANPDGFARGAQALFQSVGLGKFVPNIVLMGYKTEWISSDPSDEVINNINEYFTVIQSAFDKLLGVAILRSYESKRSFVSKEGERKSVLKKRLSRTKIHTIPQEMNVNNLSDISYFPRIKQATIDVWWLSDDGGLTLLIPHLLTLPKSYLAGAHLRIFSVTSSGKTEEDKEMAMAALLSKFRIDFKDLHIISEVLVEPKEETKEEFSKLILPFRKNEEGGWISDAMLNASSAKTNRNLRFAELLREKSKESDLVVMTLPVPRKSVVCSTLYLAWLEMLTKDLPPTLLVRGNQTDVLTFYS